MKLHRALVPAVLVLGLAVARAQEKKADEPKPFTSKLGFTITPPPGFAPDREPALPKKLAEGQTVLGIVFRAPVKDGFTPNVNVAVQGAHMKRAQVRKTQNAEWKDQGAKLLKDEDATVSGRDAIRCEVAITGDRGAHHALTLTVIDEDRVHVVTCLVKQGDMPAHEKAFRACLDSFKLEEPGAKKIPETRLDDPPAGEKKGDDKKPEEKKDEKKPDEPAAKPKAEGEKKPEEKPYRSKLGYTLTPPPGFAKQPGAKAPKTLGAEQVLLVVFKAEPKDGFAPNVNVIVQGATTTRDALRKETKDQLKLCEGKLVADDDATVSGREAIRCEFTAKFPFAEVHCLTLVVLDGDRVFTITCSAKKGGMAASAEAFKACLDSFKLEGVPWKKPADDDKD